ncbi:hypothetical protein NDU88_002068 [Pleurodeles waltl]|uniref:Uncharacterized protein n=1 Tax=Pleurodeles waltl TaxID=8319 RepID=A0AAV7REM5_PLEWA|nr:hypothetical protein NDU88_002068 [Pleurodeles waltl]
MVTVGVRSLGKAVTSWGHSPHAQRKRRGRGKCEAALRGGIEEALASPSVWQGGQRYSKQQRREENAAGHYNTRKAWTEVRKERLLHE